MKTILVATLLLFSGLGFTFDHSHKDWNTVLKKYVTKAYWVRYAQLQTDTKKLGEKHPFKRYLKALAQVQQKQYDGWNRDQKMAYLINAYNAFTFEWILRHYPTKGIKKTVGLFSSPWNQEFFNLIGGKIKALGPIEHEYLREKFKDARIHAALNCASVSCPVLQPFAFVPQKLDAQLEVAFKDFVNDTFRNQFDTKNNIIYASKIFDWFEEDFEPQYGDFKKALIKFGPPAAKSILANKGKVKWIKYDWSLNDSQSAPEPRAIAIQR